MTDKEAAAKEWLNRYEPLRSEIRSMELQLEEMRANVNKSVGIPKEVCVQTQPQNKQDERIAEIVDFEEKIKQKREILKAKEKTTLRTIDKMSDPVKRIILIYRYIYRRSWEYIGRKMHYKSSYIYEMHLKALTAIYPLIDDFSEV